MTEHDDRLPMHQMLEHARDGIDMIRGRDRSEAKTNGMLQLALVQLIQILGEAATRLSHAGRARYPDVPWSQAIGTRHRLVHGYDRVDYEVVWDTIAVDSPPLVAALERALAENPS
jgi:uncharacterized protein with HEPN domain